MKDEMVKSAQADHVRGGLRQVGWRWKHPKTPEEGHWHYEGGLKKPDPGFSAAYEARVTFEEIYVPDTPPPADHVVVEPVVDTEPLRYLIACMAGAYEDALQFAYCPGCEPYRAAMSRVRGYRNTLDKIFENMAASPPTALNFYESYRSSASGGVK